MSKSQNSARSDIDEENRRSALLGLDLRPSTPSENTQKNAAETPPNTRQRPRGKPFATGNAGRPQGARNRATLLAEAVLAGDVEEITRVIVKDALRGHPTALKECLDRFVPRTRERTVSVDLPAVATLDDAADAVGRLTALVGAGELTPREGRALAGIIDAQRRTLESRDQGRRLKALEESVAGLRTMVAEFLRSEIVVPAALPQVRDGTG